MSGHLTIVGLDGDAAGWRRCSGSGRDRMRTACRVVAVSGDHCADGETCWCRTPSVTACTHPGRSFVRDAHRRIARILPPQPLGDLLWRPIVIQFGGDHTRQLRIRRQLAHFRAPRPVEPGSVGNQCPGGLAAPVAADLSRYRRRRPIEATGDRACRQARKTTYESLETLIRSL